MSWKAHPKACAFSVFMGTFKGEEENLKYGEETWRHVFFPTVFRVVILICEKKVRGGGLAWSAKENLGRIFREALSFCFQVLEGLTSGRKKKTSSIFTK